MTETTDLKSKIEAFRYVEDVSKHSDAPVIVTRPVISKTAHRINKQPAQRRGRESSQYRDLAPSLAENLRLVFVGYNPGIQSSVQQHHYAHFSNHFWKLFNSSKLLLSVLRIHLKADLDLNDKYLPELTNGVDSFATPACDYNLVKYGIGFTDLVLRCTRTAQELTVQEKLENVPRLIAEFTSSNVENVVFIGKGIWEIVVSAMANQLGIKIKLSKSDFTWGRQQENSDPSRRTYNLILKHFSQKLPPHTRVYVFPNTSGLVTNPNNAVKQELWAQLSKDIYEEHLL